MTWCCESFHAWFEEAGRRGFAVFVAREDESEPMFVMQHRAVEVGNDPPSVVGAPVALVSDIAIAFCPWCGVHLEEWYKGQTDQLDKSSLKVPFLTH